MPRSARNLIGDRLPVTGGRAWAASRRTRPSRIAEGTPSTGRAAAQKTGSKPHRSTTGTDPGSSTRLGTATASP